MDPIETCLLVYLILGALFLLLADWLERTVNRTPEDPRTLAWLTIHEPWMILLVWLIWPLRAHHLIVGSNWPVVWSRLRKRD